MIAVRELLHHDSHLLRQRDAARRARVHDDRRGHRRPPPPPARRGDVLPHRHRRARVEDRASVAEEAGLDPKAFVDQNAAKFRRDDPAGQRVERLLHPDHRRAARAPRAGVPAADLRRRRRSTRASTRASTAVAASPSTARRSSSTARARSTASRPSGSRRRTSSSVSPPTRRRLLDLYDSNPEFVLPEVPGERGAELHRAGPRGHRVSRATPALGRARCPGTRSRSSTSGSTRSSTTGARWPSRATGEDLRPTLWPEVHHLLAKDILKFHCVIWPALLHAARRSSVPRQLFVHGYLLMDDRKMSKSVGNVIDPLELIDVYGVDALRYYLFRAVPFGQDGNISVDGAARALRARARERPRQSPLAHDGDGRALPGRDACRSSPATPDLRREARRPRAEGRGAARRARPDRAPSTRSGRSSAASTATWSERRRGSSRRTSARAAELDRVLFDLADGLRVLAIALASYLPETAPTDPRPRSARTRTWPGTGRARGRPGGATGLEPAAAAVPARRRARALIRVIDTHAHLDACRRARRTRSRARARPGSTRVITIGDDAGVVPQRRSSSRSARTASSSRSGSIPTRRATVDGDDVGRARGAARRTRRRSRSARPDSTTSATTRRATASSSSSRRRPELAVELGRSRSSSTPASAEDDTAGRARSAPGGRQRSSCTASRRSACSARPSSAAGTCPSPGNVTYPKATELRPARRASRPIACWPRPTPLPLAPAVRGRPNEPANVMHTLATLAEARGDDARRARARDRRQRDRGLRPPVNATGRTQPRARPALPGRREHPRRRSAGSRSSARTTSCSRSEPGLGVLTA